MPVIDWRCTLMMLVRPNKTKDICFLYLRSLCTVRFIFVSYSGFFQPCKWSLSQTSSLSFQIYDQSNPNRMRINLERKIPALPRAMQYCAKKRLFSHRFEEYFYRPLARSIERSLLQVLCVCNRNFTFQFQRNAMICRSLLTCYAPNYLNCFPQVQHIHVMRFRTLEICLNQSRIDTAAQSGQFEWPVEHEL